MMQSFLFSILRLKFWVWSLFPFRALYVFSDIFYFLVYHVVGYRKKVVRQNMRNAFPHKTVAELRQLERDFYHHFCDIIFETVKLLHISDEEMREHMVFTNADEMALLYKDKKNVFVMLGHYGNWEWVTSMQLWTPPSVFMAQIYRPLKNKAADQFFLNLRGRFGTTGIAKNDTLRDIIRFRKEGKQVVIGFISDQTPSKNNLHYWTTFLHQDTPCLTGAEKIAQKIDANVVYLDVHRVKRGYYEATFRVISTDAKQTAPNEITESYMRLMEESILRDPAAWLWTHKRWKHQREAAL